MPASRLTDLMPTAFRPDLNILVSRWTQQPSAAEVLRPIYEELATIAARHQIRYWLQDIRHRASNDPDITRWLLSTYFPAMAAQLGGRLHVAYLVNPALFNVITASPTFVPPEAYRNSPFTVAVFNAEGKAYGWLAQEQTEAEAVYSR